MNNESKAAVGKAAEDFSLQTEKGELWTLSAQRGKVVALLFYPGDETLVCTKQLCSVRDNWNEYLATKAVVVGVSRGTVEQHQEFARHHHLPLPLLADTRGEVTKSYRRHWWMPVTFTRAIVVIDAKGIIRYHRVMSRARRPTDYNVLSEIYKAQTELRMEQYQELLGSLRLRMGKR
jgi:peroxiredoxin Q/BCP